MTKTNTAPADRNAQPPLWDALAYLAGLTWHPFTTNDWHGFAGAGDDACTAQDLHDAGRTWVRSQLDGALVLEAYDDDSEDGYPALRYELKGGGF